MVKNNAFKLVDNSSLPYSRTPCKPFVPLRLRTQALD